MPSRLTSSIDQRQPSDESGSPGSIGPSEQERELVGRAKAGDRGAFRELVEDHQDRVFRLVIRVLNCDRDHAADLSQEVFLRVFQGLSRFDNKARFSTWLHKITMNACISEYRKLRALKRNRWTFSLDQPVSGTDDLLIEPQARGDGPADSARNREIAAAVRQAISELPDEFRQSVILRDLNGCSYEEIAEVLDAPVGTVRSRIHRGRLMLQQKLKEFQP